MEELENKISELKVYDDPEIEWLHKGVLGKELKLVLHDSREICGKLQCVDHLANIILLNATEYLPPVKVTRQLGNVIVPSKGISNILLLVEN